MFVFCQDLHASDFFHSTRPISVVLQLVWFMSAQKYYVVWLYTGRQHLPLPRHVVRGDYLECLAM